LADDVEFLSDFDLKAKLAFLQTLSVLSVPEKHPVSCGLYVLEALAAGVPVVQPESGVFPELLKMTGGGVLCEPNNAEALAAALVRFDCSIPSMPGNWASRDERRFMKNSILSKLLGI